MVKNVNWNNFNYSKNSWSDRSVLSARIRWLIDAFSRLTGCCEGLCRPQQEEYDFSLA
jgi:hypothetical protein